jgi:hypothetical protein
MSKQKTPRVNRDRRVLVPMSAAEFQLIDYAASKSNIRGTLAWMRAKLLDAAKAKLSDEVVQDILEGRATMALMRESLGESRRPQRGEEGGPGAEPVERSARPDQPDRVVASEARRPTVRAKLKLVRHAGSSKPASRSTVRASKPRSRR